MCVWFVFQNFIIIEEMAPMKNCEKWRWFFLGSAEINPKNGVRKDFINPKK